MTFRKSTSVLSTSDQTFDHTVRIKQFGVGELQIQIDDQPAVTGTFPQLAVAAGVKSAYLIRLAFSMVDERETIRFEMCPRTTNDFNLAWSLLNEKPPALAYTGRMLLDTRLAWLETFAAASRYPRVQWAPPADPRAALDMIQKGIGDRIANEVAYATEQRELGRQWAESASGGKAGKCK